MPDLVIKNGRVVTPSGVQLGGVAIDDGVITHVGHDESLPRGHRVIDARGNFVIPGLIDPHVHLSQPPGASAEAIKAQFARDTSGALHGGVTTIGHFLSEVKGKPLLPAFEMMRRAGEESSHVDFFFHGVIIDEAHLAEQDELFQRGVTSFKHFFNSTGWREPGATIAHCSEGMLFQSLENVAKLGFPAIGMVHCEEMSIIAVLMQRLKAGGRKDLEAWTEARPSFVETMRMQHAFEIAKAAGAPLYVVHISSADGVDLVANWRRQGHRVWGETLVAYLTHRGDMEEQIGCWGRNNPSLKHIRDNDRLWQGIREGSITSVGTDHLTMSLEEKQQGKGKHDNIWEAKGGMCGGIEHLLPAMMTFGVNSGRISIEDMVRVCSTNAAKIFGLYPRKGVLSPGSDADIVIVDPDRKVVVDDTFYHCQCDFSIYKGWKMKGLARAAIIGGQVRMEDYRTTSEAGLGKFVACRA